MVSASWSNRAFQKAPGGLTNILLPSGTAFARKAAGHLTHTVILRVRATGSGHKQERMRQKKQTHLISYEQKSGHAADYRPPSKALALKAHTPPPADSATRPANKNVRPFPEGLSNAGKNIVLPSAELVKWERSRKPRSTYRRYTKTKCHAQPRTM